MKKNKTQPKTTWLFATLFLVLPLLSFESKTHRLLITPVANPISETRLSVSPDVKSWAFVRNMVGSSFSDAKEAILAHGFKLEGSDDVDGGTAYYFETPSALYTYPSGKETEDFYTVGVKKGKIVSVSLSFMVFKGKDHQSLLEKWEPFEKAFSRDNYKKTDETNNVTGGQTKIVRNYSNSSQHTKMRVEILKRGSTYQMVDVILCNEDIDLGSED